MGSESAFRPDAEARITRITAFIVFPLLAFSWWCSPASAAIPALVGPRPPATQPASREIEFRLDDSSGQAIAKKALSREIAEDEENPIETSIRTAWVKISSTKNPALFVLLGCSAVGNCGLYALEKSKGGWRVILNSIAQRCTVLPSSHSGRRDISASMHGSATESAIKTYWWRGDRYVRVSERELTFDH